MLLQINGSESEPSRQDEDLDDFRVIYKLFMNFQKLENFLMAEDDLGFEVFDVLPLVEDHDRNEVDQL